MDRNALHCLSAKEWTRLQGKMERMRRGPGADRLPPRFWRRPSLSVREWRLAHAPLKIDMYRRRHPTGEVRWHWPWFRPELTRVYRSVGLHLEVA